MCAARPRHNTEDDLGKSELRRRSGDAPAAGKRQFKTPAKTRPPDRGDHRHRCRLQRRHHRRQVGLDHRLAEFTGIGTRREDIAGTGKDDALDLIIAGNGRQRGDQPGPDVVIDGVDRRPVNLDDRRCPDPVMADDV